MNNFLSQISSLSQGKYFQIVVKMILLDETIIRSNDPEEVLTFKYKKMGERFIIPWRKFKGKLRRFAMEQQRSFNIGTDCYLKDNLCMKCPVCFLFGGTGETSSAKADYNILSRIYGETFISTTKVSEINPYTANAVGEKDLSTGQALMTLITVPKETEYVGVITLKDPTAETAAILIDNISRMTRIGARSVEWGRVKCEIMGCLISDRESLSAYDIVEKIPDGLSKVTDFQLPAVNEAYQTVKNQFELIISTELSNESKKNKKKDN